MTVCIFIAYLLGLLFIGAVGPRLLQPAFHTGALLCGLRLNLGVRDGLGDVLDGFVAALVHVLAVDKECLAGDGVGYRAVVHVLVPNVGNLRFEGKKKFDVGWGRGWQRQG